jgi:hypothetical protein
MNFHPFSEIFPMIEGTAFDELVEDIKEHGLREKIWTYEGKILDGRNRFLACKKAKVKPQMRKYIGKNASAFVWSMNASRRHLSTSQLAMAVARKATLEKGANQHAQICAPSQSKVADEAKISRRSVQHARKVIDEGSKDLQRAVDSGEVSVSKAAAVVDLPKSEQLKAATQQPAKNERTQAAEPDMMPEPEPLSADEIAAMDEVAERARQNLADKVMDSDERLAAAGAEVERLARDLANMTRHRDHWMNQAGANAKFAKKLQGVIKKKDREIDSLRAHTGEAAA